MANEIQNAEQQDEAPAVTRELATWIAGFRNEDVTPSAGTWATHALLDWIGVTVAGAREPLSEILTAQYGEDDGPCTVIATGKRARAHDAALLNGSAGHALDYDDVNSTMLGHPSAPVAPVVLALGEELGASGADIIRAFIAGYEVECALGGMAGDEHYNNGFHTTGTMGTFGAAASGASLMGLDAGQTLHALGLAATQAAGLKSMFGTMAKPLHAGKAAMNGLMAAQMASRGFTAGADAIECAQGFMAVAAPGFVPQRFSAGANAEMQVENNLFKYHAACYLTHSTIEAVGALREQHGIGLDDLKELKLFMPAANRLVCDIPDPVSGLEIKFSIRQLALMALDGANTAALDAYSDENAVSPRYAEARRKIDLVEKPLGGRMAGAVSIETTDGRTMVSEVDVSKPARDVEAQWQRLQHKARTVMTPGTGAERADEIIGATEALAQAPTLDRLMTALA